METAMGTDNTNKLKIHTLLSLLILAIGVALLIFMVLVENEPGAIPLLLIVVGTGWYIYARHRSRLHNKEE